MDFGLFFLMQRDEGWSEQAVYDSAVEQMLAAEPLGYQSVWIAEHHFMDIPGIETAAALRSMRLFVEAIAPAMKPVPDTHRV